MAKSNAIRAGRAFVELFADDTKLVRGLRAAEKKLKAFGTAISRMGRQMVGLGAAVLTPLVAVSKAFAAMGDAMGKMSKRTGFSTEALSELSFAAQQSGTTIETLEGGVRKMQRTISDAGQGSKSAADALGMLGLSYGQLAKLSPEAQFKLLADRLSQIKNPTLRAALAMQVFGKSGTAMLPMLENGAAGIEALQEEARALGLTMSGQDAAAAEEFTDALGRLWKVVKMSTFQIGAALAPALQELSGWVTKVVVTFNDWLKNNRQVVVMVAKIAAAVVAGGIALMLFGGTISALGLALGKLASVIVFAGTVFKTLGAAIAFLANPVVLVIAAVAALGAYLLYASGAGAKALSWLGSKFQELRNTATEAFGGIGDALAAGDIAFAAKILWLTLKMEFTRGVNALQKMWLDFRNVFIRIAYDAWDGTLAAAALVWHALESGWIETTAFLSRLWSMFEFAFVASWETMKAAAKKAWVWIKGLFDDAMDTEAAYKQIDDAKEAAIAKSAQKFLDKDAEVQRRRKERRDSSATMRDATLEQIGQQSAERHKKLDAAYTDKMTQNAADLEAARKEWQDALGTARQKRAEKEVGPGRMRGPGQIEPPDMSLLAGAFDAAVQKISTAGGFSGFGRFGAEGQGAAERTANGVEQIAKNTRELLQLQRDSDETVV